MKWTKIIIDLETTGFTPKNAGVTEISCVLATEDHSETKVLYDSLTNPGYLVPQEIIELNGITDDMVKGKPYWKIQLRKVGLFALKHNLMIIAHNTDFEKTFINVCLRPEEQERIIWGDSAAHYIALNKGMFPQGRYSKGWRLEAICGKIGVEFDPLQAHRAMYDVIKTNAILEVMEYKDRVEMTKNYNDFSRKLIK